MSGSPTRTPPERPSGAGARPKCPGARPRAAALALALLGLLAACGSSAPGAGSTGGAPGSPEALGPWQGTLEAAALPAPVQSLRAVDCPRARRCFAVGAATAGPSAPAGPELLTTSDGGAAWRHLDLPPGVGYLAGISCASERACTAVGQVGQTGVGPGAIVTTVDGGATWTLATVPPGTTDVTAVDCPGAGRCVALATVSGRVTALVPSSAGTWTARGPLPAVASAGTALSCTDATHCWATAARSVDVAHVIGVIATTSDGGTTWTVQRVPVGTGALQDIDCTRGTSDRGTSSGTGAWCTAVGTTATVPGAARTGRGVVLTSEDGGRSWASAPVAASAADLLAVSCGAGPCVAVGTTVATAPRGGLVILTGAKGASGPLWQKAVTVPVALPLTGVSCVSLAACLAVGESVTVRLAAG